MQAAVQSRLDSLRWLLEDERPKSAIERLCYARQISDLENIGHNGLEWDEEQAQRAVAFFKLLKHWNGQQFVGKPFIPEPWQEHMLIAPVFGWKRRDEFSGQLVRRINEVYCEIPRKNGKSFLSSGVASQGLLADGETAPEVYSAASRKEQAKIVFNDCKQTLSASPLLAKHIKTRQHYLECLFNKGTLQAISSDYNMIQGRRPSRVIIDELHVHKTRDTYDALIGGVGGRQNWMIFMITTAGSDRSSICWERREHARVVLDGHVSADTFWAFITQAEPDDDIQDPQTWWKANPNLGVSVFSDYMKTQSLKAATIPSAENDFRRVHLNQWTNQVTRWLSVADWDACQSAVDAPDAECFAALDCGNTRDPNALSIIWRVDSGYVVRNWYWMPEEAANDRAEYDRQILSNWARQGLIRTTPGNVTDYTGELPQQIGELLHKYRVKKLAYDPWNTAALQQALYNRLPDVEYIAFRQNMANFAAPTRELERLVLTQQIHHNGDPVLRWMVGNVAVQTDVSGNIRPDKGKSEQKIDGVVAMIMALGLHLVDRTEPSVYEERGLLVL